MALIYNRLWKLLIDRNLKKSDLHLITGLSQSTIAKLAKGENVNTDVLERICVALNCELSDIAEVRPDAEETMPTTDYKRAYDVKWNFKEGSMREYVHGLHPYPAMMMPLIAREMLKAYGNGSDTVFLDPYVGSGTTIAEAQLYGVKTAYGFDLNPLALLISKVKTQALDLAAVKAAYASLPAFLDQIGDNYETPEFSILRSWFREKNIVELSKLRAFVFSIEDEDVRDFFKVCFSEVTRSVSETRNGEFKLYRMAKKSLENFNPDAIELFHTVAQRNIKIMEDACVEYCTDVNLIFDSSAYAASKYGLKNSVDLIVTSPPYGDSHTTVAYGQFSRLSNEWLGFKNAGQVDAGLLGGKKMTQYTFDIPELDDAITQIKAADDAINGDRYKSVISFYYDYQQTINAIAETVKVGGYAVFVVGNRRVRNVELPLDVVTFKMFEKFGFEHIITHVRDILNKRMPSKASPSNEQGEQVPTMTNEYIVVMRRTK